MKRSFVRGLARGLAGVLFLAQMTVAAYACPGLSSAIAAAAPMGQVQAMAHRSAAAAPQGQMDNEAGAVATAATAITAATAATAATVASMPDCSDMVGARDPDAANLCAEHCKVGQQSDHASTLTVPAVILNVLYATPAVPPTPLPRCTAALTGALAAASPPHAILHCVFRI